MNRLLLAAALLCLALPAAAKKKPAPAPAAETLAAGRYTAKVKLLACSGCGPEVEKALRSIKGVEAAKVDSDKSEVAFTVAKDAQLSVAELQKTLKKSADEMGMGADYSLSKIQALAPAPAKS